MEIQLKNIEYSYGNRNILKNFNYTFEKASFTAIKGKSGSGKSTLLNIIGLVNNPSNGEVIYKHDIVSNIKYRKKIKYFRYYLSFIFQDFLLLPEMNVESNLLVASRFIKKNKKDTYNLYMSALKKVGMEDINLKRPVHEFSGGEQQRIAIARSFIKPCKIILADEPTGSLDYKNGKKVMDLLKELQKLGKTVIVVTHSNKFDDYFDDIINLK